LCFQSLSKRFRTEHYFIIVHYLLLIELLGVVEAVSTYPGVYASFFLLLEIKD
jgi:hypothetical protein